VAKTESVIVSPLEMAARGFFQVFVEDDKGGLGSEVLVLASMELELTVNDLVSGKCANGGIAVG
jgi:hypothetical protein